MKLKKIVFLLVIFIAYSCSKGDAKPEQNETYVFDHIDLIFVDDEGRPLLDTSIDHAIESELINVYYVRNEEIVKVEDPFKQTDPGFLRVGGEIPTLRFFFGINVSNEATGEIDNRPIGQSVRFIELYSGDIDTLVGNWIGTKSGHALTRITYNKRIIYDSSEGIGENISSKIVK